MFHFVQLKIGKNSKILSQYKSNRIEATEKVKKKSNPYA
jgi:hypothetical protein